MNLAELLCQSVARRPDALAVSGPDAHLTYRQLDSLANRVARALAKLGVGRGDRVGVWLPKSAKAVAAMQGVLKLGAAYVPVDPMSPPLRARTILHDCTVRGVITEHTWAEAALTNELAQVPRLTIGGRGPEAALAWEDLDSFDDKPLVLPELGGDELAYILYTSGSTGRPKGVCISHQNALAFIEWAAGELQATERDRFSNHAPFHFDLSVLDLYVAFLAGASVSLIADGLSYSPSGLVKLIQDEQISVWYSVPSALVLMMERGGLLEIPEEALPLRAVLFAGEPFPIKHLRRLRRHLSKSRFLNLYGPTETNVCTYYEVHDIPEEQTQPVPIGRASCGDRVWAVKPDGTGVAAGEEGELFVSGPTVMLGYWGHPPQKDSPYPTGDLVRLLEDGNYVYAGRRDHMVKVRGHRVELGEVEAALLTYPGLRDAAAIVVGAGMEARLIGCFSLESPKAPSLLEIKRHCAERLPRYMIVHEIRVLKELPRTRNGKVDRLRLIEEATRAVADR